MNTSFRLVGLTLALTAGCVSAAEEETGDVLSAADALTAGASNPTVIRMGETATFLQNRSHDFDLVSVVNPSLPSDGRPIHCTFSHVAVRSGALSISYGRSGAHAGYDGPAPNVTNSIPRRNSSGRYIGATISFLPNSRYALTIAKPSGVQTLRVTADCYPITSQNTPATETP